MSYSCKSPHYAHSCTSGRLPSDVCRSRTSPAFQLVWSVGLANAGLLSNTLSLNPDRDHMFAMPYNLFNQVVKSLFTLNWCCALMYFPVLIPAVLCILLLPTLYTHMGQKCTASSYLYALFMNGMLHVYISIVQIRHGVRTAVNKQPVAMVCKVGRACFLLQMAHICMIYLTLYLSGEQSVHSNMSKFTMECAPLPTWIKRNFVTDCKRVGFEEGQS